MRKEIKILKKEHAYWVKYSDESRRIFDIDDRNRKEQSRALAEYKRIIVKKADVYKDEFKLIKEYKMLKAEMGDDVLSTEFGVAVQEKIKNYVNVVAKSWYEMDNVIPDFDVKTAKEIISKMRKKKKITKEDRESMENILIPNDELGSNRPKQVDEDNESFKKRIKSPNIFTKDGIDQAVIENILSKSGMGQLSPEKYMALIYECVKLGGEKEKRDEALKYIVGENNEYVINSIAKKGADQLKQYMEMTEEERKNHPNNDILEDFAKAYSDSKDEIDAAAQPGQPTPTPAR